MADTTLQVAAPGLAAPATVVSAIREFAAAREGTSAVVEYHRRRGARIVLAGSDGSSEEVFAPATDVARDACREAGVDVVNTWERELFDEIRARASMW